MSHLSFERVDYDGVVSTGKLTNRCFSDEYS